MFIRMLPATLIALCLSGPATAATLTQVIALDPFSAGPAISESEGGWVRKRGSNRSFFDGFDATFGAITGARLIIEESWTLDAHLTGNGSAGVNKAKGQAITSIQIGTRKTTDMGPFKNRLSNVRTRNAICQTISDTDSCSSDHSKSVEATHEFTFDAVRAEDLFLDPAKMLIRWNIRSRLRGSGVAEAFIHDGAIKATLHVNYDPSPVPLPASGLGLITAFAGLALFRTRRTSLKS